MVKRLPVAGVSFHKKFNAGSFVEMIFSMNYAIRKK